MYQAGLYARLSKEDRSHTTSESIENQIAMMEHFVENEKEISVAKVYKDDGYSGANFNRPAFLEMMEDIQNGTINCIVVKDFSRLGRNYIETCKYIEKVFPFLQVRFIAINDGYDSSADQKHGDEILIPFQNLINDAYLGDISLKIRSQMEVKRKKGEFIGAFTVYGYTKAEENKNTLVEYGYAASVVKEIFRWKLEGYSNQKIADILNMRGELSPLAYKKQRGSHFFTPFTKGEQASWSHSAVGRILQNEIYMGTLQQGKTTTPNHKIKEVVQKEKTKWCIVEHNHPAIITPREFTLVQKLLEKDTRISPNCKVEYPFSGLLFCGDCGYQMVRRTVTHRKKDDIPEKYIYYICGKYKKDGSCTTHNISENKLVDAVQKVLEVYMQLLLTEVDCTYIPFKNQDTWKNDIQDQEKESILYQWRKQKAYIDYQEGILTAAEYQMYAKRYEAKYQESQKTMETLLQLQKEPSKPQEKKYLDMLHLVPTKKLYNHFIDGIDVQNKNHIKIRLQMIDELEEIYATSQPQNR